MPAFDVEWKKVVAVALKIDIEFSLGALWAIIFFLIELLLHLHWKNDQQEGNGAVPFFVSRT